MPTEEQLRALHALLDKNTLSVEEPCTAEEESPGVVTIRRLDGSLKMQMPTSVYEELRAQKESK